MSQQRHLLAANRPGRPGWLAPLSLGLAVVSWLLLVGGVPIALAAVGCAIRSMTTGTEYRLDWTAVAGLVVAAGQLLLSLVLLASTLSGH